MTVEQRRSGVFIINFERISYIFLAFIVCFEQVNAVWEFDEKNFQNWDSPVNLLEIVLFPLFFRL